MKTALSAREKDMQKIIDDPKNREDLVQWSRKALIDENVEFLLAVKTFKENALKGSRDIYAKFLAEDSELPINHNALKELDLKVYAETPSAEMWDPIQEELLNLLINNEAVEKFEDWKQSL
eukprot:TRINITY_DN708_c0_g1_i2.p1 TRINITY_DN708_c0_g1~~TRINITY_DN708_c0_g1_i2.p1  ORF type:complete len:121 (+),score=38.77 TRINITY_DN708_c0_g1_i2:138-500(+)